MKLPEDIDSSKYEVISFDMDGVLLDSEDFSPGSWIHRMLSKTLKHLGIPPTEQNMKKIYIWNIIENYDEVCGEFEIKDPKKLWKIREKYLLEEKSRALKEGEIAPFGDVEAIKNLNNHYKLTVVTNSPQSIADYFIKRYRLRNYLALWIGRDSKMSAICRMKPDPYLLEKMMSKIGSRKVLYVGDTDKDREAAHRAGVDFILLSRNNKNRGSISNLWQLEEYLC